MAGIAPVRFVAAGIAIMATTGIVGQAKEHGVTPAADPYSWLEARHGAESQSWVRTRNDRTVRILTGDRDFQRYYDIAQSAYESEARIAGADPNDSALHGGWVYDLWVQKGKSRGVWRRARVDNFAAAAAGVSGAAGAGGAAALAWEDLLDVDELSRTEGKEWVLHNPATVCLPPKDTRCMVSLSSSDNSVGIYREFDTESRSFVKNGFVAASIRQGALAWKDIDTLFIAADLGPGSKAKSGAPLTVREWKRAQPLASSKEIFRAELDGIVALIPRYLATPERGPLFLITEYDNYRNTRNWRLDADGRAALMTLPSQPIFLTFYANRWVFWINDDWRIGGKKFQSGSLLSIRDDVITQSTPFVDVLMAPDSTRVLSRIAGAHGGILATVYDNCRARLELFTLEDDVWKHEEMRLPDSGSIQFSIVDSETDIAFVTYESFLEPTTLYAVDVRRKRASVLQKLPTNFPASKFVVEQLTAVSKDGTRVPYFLVRPKNLRRNSLAPTLLHGYGGFGNPQYPNYSEVLGSLWLNEGGVYVVANIRGGGEFGPAWHSAATKTRRQNSYEDFIAVAEDLIKSGVTSPRHLGISGHSNGGLLVGVMLTQRPDLFHAAVAEVPYLDLLRPDLTSGAMESEYGSLDVPEERAFLEQISPYEHLAKRQGFPIPLLLTSTTDENVHPAHARKFAAKMEALGMPFLFYESPVGGHFTWLTPREHAFHDALIYTYLKRQLK